MNGSFNKYSSAPARVAAGMALIILAGLSASHDPVAEYGRQPVDEEQAVYEDFILRDGLEISYFIERRQPRLRLIQLADGSRKGRAEDYFFEASACYDVTVHYVDGTEGASSLEVMIGGQSIGKVESGSSGSIMEQTFRGIHVRKWSRIDLVFTGDGKGKCRVDRLSFSRTGDFAGNLVDLEKPKTPRLFETSAERRDGRKMLPGYVGSRMDSLMELRRAALDDLKNPAEWEAWQRKTRERLPVIFGEFPGKTPLNARITGSIEREDYSIEKVVFESQPGYYVTSNLYLPRGREFPLPGIVFTCGHSPAGKSSRLYHEACLGMVLKGYVVLAFDPMGQGERSEYMNIATGRDYIRTVDQHFYLGWPTMFVDWSLAGLRVWDGVRAVDYLVSRPEVDQTRLGVVGNSGGGQMSFLIAAADPRIDVCVSAHPGGPMENTYLSGFGQGSRNLADREILSLIPPRPCRIVVGRESGEIERHRPKYEDMLLFYKGLGCPENLEYTLVDGVHDMRQPKREASYEWFNKWFGKQEEGKAEPELQPEDPESLWCTESGSTLVSLGGETGRTLNIKRMERVYRPAENPGLLKQEIASRLGGVLNHELETPTVKYSEKFKVRNILVEKFCYQSEPGITIPSVLYNPLDPATGNPIYLFCPVRGKPMDFNDTNLPMKLAGNGSTVLAIDVRGTGETAPVPYIELNQSAFDEDAPPKPNHHYILRSAQYVPANQALAFGRTMAGMRAYDVLMGVQFIRSREDLKGRRIILVGEGSGGLWALLAAVFDPGVSGMVTLGTVPSYKLFITRPYYSVWDYFWVPGVLKDFDIPDLVRLVSPRTQVWIDPLNVTGEKFDHGGALRVLGPTENLQIITTDNSTFMDPIQIIKATFE